MRTNSTRKREFERIIEGFERFHSIFYAIVDMGYPVFTDSEKVPTACVRFDRAGLNIAFEFNENFWDTLDDYSRAFIICHECLHVILNHGARTTDCINPYHANLALDVVVNHLLCDKFGFERDRVDGAENLCWRDTVFAGVKEVVEPNRSFEYYYDLMMRSIPEDQKIKVSLVDDHSGLKDFDSPEFGKAAGETVAGRVGKGEIQDFLDKTKGDVPKPSKDTETPEHPPGGHGSVGEPPVVGSLRHICSVTAIFKKKWETIIKTWESRAREYADEEQWVHKARRMAIVGDELSLPADHEEEGFSKNKLDVFFFLDSSGSCWHLKDRFFAAAASLNPKKFNVRLFCRTTEVMETSLESKVMSGNGSDDFRCMENFIQKELKEGKIKKYPAAVFHITDGHDCSGVMVNPQIPSRWYWFLTEQSTEAWIPKKCNIYKLNDFE